MEIVSYLDIRIFHITLITSNFEAFPRYPLIQNSKYTDTKHTYRFCVQLKSFFVVFLHIFLISFGFFSIGLRKTATEKYWKQKNLSDKNVLKRYKCTKTILLVQFRFLIYIHLLFHVIFFVKSLFFGRFFHIRHVPCNATSSRLPVCAQGLTKVSRQRSDKQTEKLKRFISWLPPWNETSGLFNWDETKQFHSTEEP